MKYHRLNLGKGPCDYCNFASHSLKYSSIEQEAVGIAVALIDN